MSAELRQYIRTEFSTRVKIMHPSFGEYTSKTRDLSQGGVFLVTGGAISLSMGDEVDLQTLDMMAEAPIVKARVVRIEREGVALMFCDQ